MDLLHPNLSSRVLKRQEQQKQTHDTKVGTCRLTVGDLDFSRTYSCGQPMWIPAQIVQQTGPVSFKVKLPDGGIHRQHQDQLRKWWDRDTATFDPSPASTGTSVKPTDPVPPQTPTASQKPAWEGLEPPPR